MRVAYLTPEYATPATPDGGLANYLRKIGQELTARGHSVDVFVLSRRTTHWEDGRVHVYEIKRPRLAGRSIPAVRALLPAVEQMLAAQRLARALWRVHRRAPFDVMQASSYAAPGYAVRQNGRVPLVCRASSYTPLLRATFGARRTFADTLTDWLEVRQLIDADACFAPSQLVADTYARFENCRPAVIRTPIERWNGTMDDSFYRQHLAGLRYLLYFGTLSRVKGADLVGEAIGPVLARWPDLHLVFVGRDDGLSTGEKVLDNVRTRVGVHADRVHYHPVVPKAQLYPIIQGSIAALMPSRADNYPNACLEAQSVGVPVIGTDGSSLDEMIVDGETGFLARNGDPQSLCAAIHRVLDETPDQRAAMRARTLAAVERAFAEDRVGQLIAFYQATIKRGAGVRL